MSSLGTFLQRRLLLFLLLANLMPLWIAMEELRPRFTWAEALRLFGLVLAGGTLAGSLLALGILTVIARRERASGYRH
jgi:hypothetical protein